MAGAKLSLGGSTIYSDSMGHYSFNNLTQGTYFLAASAPGYLARSYSINITAGTTANQNISLSTAGVLQGTVTNGSGVGIAGATISISGRRTTPLISLVTTGSSGGFSFGWVPVGAYVVTAAASGYVSNTMSTTVNTGQTTTIAVSLSTATASISGRVTSAVDGHALAGATVSTGLVASTTDSYGNYRFTSLPVGS